jgi:glycosyltransferase 2 family protein
VFRRFALSRNKNLARLTKHAIGILLTIVCLTVFFQQVELDKIILALSNFNYVYLIFGVLFLGVGYASRIFRWSIMLKSTGSEAGFAACCAPFLGSITLNNVLPFRIGDIVRALVFPASMGITKAVATSSLIVERLIDLVTLLMCFALGLFAIEGILIPMQLKISAILLAATGFLTLFSIIFFSNVLGDFFNKKADMSESLRLTGIFSLLRDLFRSLNSMSRPNILFAMITISAAVWIGEAGLFYFVLHGMYFESVPIEALLVMSVATLSTLLPSSPGYVGTFHLAVFTAVSLIGGTALDAAGYAIIVHLALWLPTTLVGAIAIWLYPELFRVAKPKF